MFPATFRPLFGFFETPLVALLAAAGAASIPVLIHLFNRNRYRVVNWAAMRFLLAAQRKTTRRMRLEQMILLAVRVLIALLLVLAMASAMPWAESIWGRLFPRSMAYAGGLSLRTHKVLVIDGSMSMALKIGNGSCFDRAQAAATQLVQESPAGDAFSVILMTSPPRRIVPEPADDPRKVVKEIQALHLPQGNADLGATLSAVEEMVRSENSPDKFEEKEIYFITDLQRATWIGRQGSDPTAALERIKTRARTIFVDVGQDGANNLAVTNLTLEAPLATTGTMTSFTATIHNYGADTRKQVPIELLVGKGRATASDAPFELRISSQKLVDVAPGQTEAVTFHHKFTMPGDYAVQVKLDHDALEPDDVRSVVVSVKETVPVMLVNGKPDKDPYNEATEWLRDALNPFESGQTPSNVPARPRVVTDSDFHDAGLGDLTPYDCVFLCDVKLLTAAEVSRLETHLRRGGGVVFCLGPDVDLESYNRLVYRDGEGILPARLLGIQEAPANRAFTFYTDEDNSQKLPLKAFSGNDKASLLAARFHQYVRAELPPKGRARKVLSFMPQTEASDQKTSSEALPANDPALVEWSRYRGRVVLLTSTVNMDWTTWPLSPSFPAMMQELFHFAIAGRLREQAFVVGEPLEEYLPLSGAGLDVDIRTPEGHSQAARTQDYEDVSVLRWNETDVNGIYRAVIGQDPQDHLFAVNVPIATDSQQACESDLTRTNREELRSTYPGWDIQIVTNLHDIVHRGGSAVAAGQIPGRGIGPTVAAILLLLMMVLLLAEVVLAWLFGHYSKASGIPGSLPASGWVLPSFIAVCVGGIFLCLGGILIHAAWTGDFCGFLPDVVRRGIEGGLGISPPAPGESTRWHLAPTPSFLSAAAYPWLASFFGLGVAALVSVIYLQEGRMAGVPYKLLLAGLRIGFVLLVLAVLLPQLRLLFERQGWPDIAIIIDDSRSMSTTDHYQDPRVQEASERLGQVASLEAPERLQLAQALIMHGKPDWLQTLLLKRRVKVHVYHCSGGAARVPNGDVTDRNDPKQHDLAVDAIRNLQAEGESSQLGKAVRQVLNDFRGSSLSAVIMLTDGVTTDGEDLVKVGSFASQQEVPLFFVGIGDSHEIRDLKLHDLQVEDSVYVHDRVIFEAQLTGQGYTDLAVPVTLREKGKDKVLATQMVKVDPQGKPVKFRLSHQPTEPGEKVYVLDVPVQPDEVQAGNNHLERTVFVRATKLIKVLYVEGGYRWEFQKVKTLLERESAQDPRNKTIDLKVLLLGAEQNWAGQDKSATVAFPSKIELNQYDVVIFGDVDPTDDRVQTHLPDVADFVRERGGGFLMIAGPQYSPSAYKDTPLRDILPIEVVGPEPPDPANAGDAGGPDLSEGFRPELTAIGRFHPIFRFSPDEAENTAIWNKLQTLHWWSECYRAKWGSEVLTVHPTRKALTGDQKDGVDRQSKGDDRHPLIVQQFVGAGRSMFFGIDETWLWGFREDLLRFNQFWIQTVRYLSRSRLGRISLRLDGQSPYERGKEIKVTVRFPDDAPPPPPETQVKVNVTRTLAKPDHQDEVEEETLPLTKVEGSRATYEGALTRTPEGDYVFQLSSPTVEGGSRPRAECRVVAPPGEMDRLRMNQEDMEYVAEQTQGHFYNLADADRVLDDLPPGTRVSLNTPQLPRLLWNDFLIFALAVSLLSTEWFLRKRKHLL